LRIGSDPQLADRVLPSPASLCYYQPVMLKTIGVFLSMFTVFLLAAFPTYAQNDVTVTFQTTPLFSSTDGLWFPERSLSKNFTVENQGSSEVQLTFTAQNVQGGVDYYNMAVTSGNEVFYNGALRDFLSSGPYSLGNLGAGQTRGFEVALELPEDTPLEASGSLVEFDFTVQVSEEDEEEEDEEEEGEEQAVAELTGSGSDNTSDGGSVQGEVSYSVGEELEGKKEGKELKHDVLKPDKVEVLGEISKKAQTEESEGEKATSLLDILLQNNPNLWLLIFEEAALLTAILFFSKRSGYFRLLTRV